MPIGFGGKQGPVRSGFTRPPSDLVLAWEIEQDFVDLHESIRQELNPVGSLEDIAVLDIARLHWVKRRLNVGAQLAYHRQTDAPALQPEEGWQG